MADFILFGTEGCHLCEEAENILRQTQVPFEQRDILYDDEEQQRYGIRIPVLRHCGSGRELDWPFDLETAQAFIRQAIAE